jgi:hypothetical protein
MKYILYVHTYYICTIIPLNFQGELEFLASNQNKKWQNIEALSYDEAVYSFLPSLEGSQVATILSVVN